MTDEAQEKKKSDNNPADDEELPRYIWYSITAIGVVVFGGFAANWFLAFNLLSHWQERGTVGDTFGVANTLFTGLAFGAVFIALLLQREDLAYQRRQLATQNRTLADSTRALRLQYEALQMQHQEMKEYREHAQRSADAQDRMRLAMDAQTARMEDDAQLEVLRGLTHHLETQYPHGITFATQRHREMHAYIGNYLERWLAKRDEDFLRILRSTN